MPSWHDTAKAYLIATWQAVGAWMFAPKMAYILLSFRSISFSIPLKLCHLILRVPVSLKHLDTAYQMSIFNLQYASVFSCHIFYIQYEMLREWKEDVITFIREKTMQNNRNPISHPNYNILATSFEIWSSLLPKSPPSTKWFVFFVQPPFGLFNLKGHRKFVACKSITQLLLCFRCRLSSPPIFSLSNVLVQKRLKMVFYIPSKNEEKNVCFPIKSVDTK